MGIFSTYQTHAVRNSAGSLGVGSEIIVYRPFIHSMSHDTDMDLV